MKRGEIWTISAGDDARKPRPAVVVQDDSFDTTSSVTICPLTTDVDDAGLFRLPIEPSPDNGLRHSSAVMIDKVTTIRRVRCGHQIGHLSNDEMAKLSRALIVFLGLAGTSR